jgi:hypothetical protein
MSTKRTESLWLAAYLLISSSAFPQTRVPLPPDSEQLLVWKVSYSEWFQHWETAEMRCNIDDPTLYRMVRLDDDTDPYADIKTASRQTEELDRRIVRGLKKQGWSRVKPASSRTSDRSGCFQRHDSYVQIYKRCASRSCTFYEALTLTYYLRIPPGSPP